jgi:hypothetical protein
MMDHRPAALMAIRRDAASVSTNLGSSAGCPCWSVARRYPPESEGVARILLRNKVSVTLTPDVPVEVRRIHTFQIL